MLSDLTIRQAKYDGKRVKLKDKNGLYVLIDKHSKRFYLRYTYRSKQHEKALGEYPILSLLEARKIALDVKISLQNNVNPFAQKNNLVTFEELFYDLYNKSAISERVKKSRFSRYNRYIKPYIGNITFTEVIPQDILDILLPVYDKGLEATAFAIRSDIRQVYEYAAIKYQSTYDPTIVAKGIKKTIKIRHHRHIIDVAELGKLLARLKKCYGNSSSSVKDALFLLPYVFVRASELRKAHYSEFDLENGLWRIPAEKMKMRRPHIVPLAKQVITLIDRRFSIVRNKGYLFPSPVSNNGYLSHTTFGTYLKSFNTKTTLHGFRSTASTLLHEMGYEERYIEMQLAHVSRNSVAASYNHAAYLSQRREMMQFWADYLDGLIEKYGDDS